MRLEYENFSDILTYNRITSLSATSVALCVSALRNVHKRYVWQYAGEKLNDTQWDELDKAIGEALTEIMSEIVGLMFPSILETFNGLPVLLCDGSQYQRVDYPLLYERTKAALIIDSDNFYVPDMRGVVPVGSGNGYTVNDTGGEETHQLTIAEMPAHDHTFTKVQILNIDLEGVGVPDPTSVGLPELPATTNSRGGSQAHNNMQPYRVVDWVIVAG